jgi:hypothetical protein
VREQLSKGNNLLPPRRCQGHMLLRIEANLVGLIGEEDEGVILEEVPREVEEGILAHDDGVIKVCVVIVLIDSFNESNRDHRCEATSQFRN